MQMDDSWKIDYFSLVATYGKERQKEDKTIRSEKVKTRKEEREKRIRSNGGWRLPSCKRKEEVLKRLKSSKNYNFIKYNIKRSKF